MRAFTRRVMIGLLAVAAAGTARADEALKAKVGVLRLSSSAPVFIAQDKGYFREAGLDIELKFFDAAQPIAVATTSGDVDFGITAFTAGLYNLAGKGTLKVIGGIHWEALKLWAKGAPYRRRGAPPPHDVTVLPYVRPRMSTVREVA